MVKIALAHESGRPSPSTESPSPEAGADGQGASESTANDPVVVALLPAARAAADVLEGGGRRLSRHALAEALRAEGYPASNARVSALVRVLRTERGGDLSANGTTRRRPLPTDLTAPDGVVQPPVAIGSHA